MSLKIIEYSDVETGLYYLNSRYYDPEIGRFISADDISYLDPSSIGGLNLYAYCGNDPVNRWDPSGRFWDYVLDIIGIGLGINEVRKDPKNWKNWAWLGADVVLGLLPFIPAFSSARHLNKVDDVLDLASSLNKFDNAGDTLNLLNKADNLELHHFLTNKHKYFTPQFDNIVRQYGLHLDDAWNTAYMTHKGRHAHGYHRYMLKEVNKINNLANGDVVIFLTKFDDLKLIIINNPNMLRKAFWLF